MSTQGIQGFYVATRDYAATSALWASFGYTAVFETDHDSGQWVHPAGGPYVFIAHQEGVAADETHPILFVDDAASFTMPSGATVARPFEPQHWGVTEAIVLDPDGRPISLQAPLPDA